MDRWGQHFVHICPDFWPQPYYTTHNPLRPTVSIDLRALEMERSVMLYRPFFDGCSLLANGHWHHTAPAAALQWYVCAGAHQMLWTGSSKNEKQPAKCGFWGFGSLDLKIMIELKWWSRHWAWFRCALTALHSGHCTVYTMAETPGEGQWQKEEGLKDDVHLIVGSFESIEQINVTKLFDWLASNTSCMPAKRTESLALTMARWAFDCHHLLVYTCQMSHVHIQFSQ